MTHREQILLLHATIKQTRAAAQLAKMIHLKLSKFTLNDGSRLPLEVIESNRCAYDVVDEFSIHFSQTVLTSKKIVIKGMLRISFPPSESTLGQSP